MDTQTHANVLSALRSEAFAHARYTMMAVEAGEEGDAEVAALLRGIANIALHEHFAELSKQVRLIGADADNLVAAIQHEGRELDQIYRAFAEQARAAGETAIAEQFEAIRADKRDHLHSLEAALEDLEIPA